MPKLVLVRAFSGKLLVWGASARSQTTTTEKVGVVVDHGGESACRSLFVVEWQYGSSRPQPSVRCENKVFYMDGCQFSNEVDFGVKSCSRRSYRPLSSSFKLRR